MNTEALLRLADKLEGKGEYLKPVPQSEFNMSDWRCGTAACAIGHAGTDPWFIKRGFSMASSKFLPGGAPFYKDQYGIVYRGWMAVYKFFDFPDDSGALRLFEPSYYSKKKDMTPTNVANRIRAFVKNGRP